jgi:hypothetical protein
MGFDATIFAAAQNEANSTDVLADVPVGATLLAATEPR